MYEVQIRHHNINKPLKAADSQQQPCLKQLHHSLLRLLALISVVFLYHFLYTITCSSYFVLHSTVFEHFNNLWDVHCVGRRLCVTAVQMCQSVPFYFLPAYSCYNVNQHGIYSVVWWNE